MDLAWTSFITVFGQGIYADHVAWEQIHSSFFFFIPSAQGSELSFSLNMGIVLFDFMFLKIKSTLERRNGPSHLSCGSVQCHVSRKFIHQLVCGLSLQGDRLHFHPLGLDYRRSALWSLNIAYIFLWLRNASAFPLHCFLVLFFWMIPEPGTFLM